MRLTDTDKISNYIKSEINPYGKPFEGNAYEFGLKLMKYLENASVDYDVDNVVEQLKDESEKSSICELPTCKEDESHCCYCNGLNKAIKIVKAGGMNNNSKTSD